MRALTRVSVFIAAVILLGGCSGSEQTVDMESRDPYWLTYDGPARRAENVLRRRLSFDGWSLLRSERGTITAQKVLSPDEMASSKVVMGDMVGGGGGGQEGRVRLSIEKNEDATWVSMTGMFANEGAPTSRQETARRMKRKHPLMVKMGLRLHGVSGFKLATPPPSVLRRWARAKRR